jgi:tRNA pseudouridine55 synthase
VSSTGLMRGVVNLDKPVGPTSHDMVALLRRLTGTRRIGHAGTLDPLASGVLPILVGNATRFSEELTAGQKRYRATIRLGLRSASDDAEGPVQPGSGPPPDRATVEEALTTFVGTIEQRPPAFSARKAGGQTAHRSARAGRPLELAARQVTIDAIDLLGVRSGDGWLDAEIEMRCGPGTYVRSLARDLGDLLGCGGYLGALRRTEASGLRVEDASRPEDLERLAGEGRLEDVLQPIAGLLPLPRIILDRADADRFVHGTAVPIGGSASGRHAVFSADELLGVGRLTGGTLQPTKVVVTEMPA